MARLGDRFGVREDSGSGGETTDGPRREDGLPVELVTRYQAAGKKKAKNIRPSAGLSLVLACLEVVV